jgi:hypothetical protein
MVNIDKIVQIDKIVNIVNFLNVVEIVKDLKMGPIKSSSDAG